MLISHGGFKAREQQDLCSQNNEAHPESGVKGGHSIVGCHHCALRVKQREPPCENRHTSTFSQHGENFVRYNPCSSSVGE